MLQKTSIIGIWVDSKERTHARGKAVNPWYGMVWYGMVGIASGSRANYILVVVVGINKQLLLQV